MSRRSLPAGQVTRPRFCHVIVDRDGVINREAPDGWVTDRRSWEWETGAVEGLRMLRSSGIVVSVATNQSCIGRGLVDRSEVDALHRWMSAELRSVGVDLIGIHVCPHAPDGGCRCRKPAPGLVEAALASTEVPVRSTLVVGDDLRDIGAGRAAGTSVALVRTGKGRRASEMLDDVAAFEDLVDLARWLTDPGDHPSGRPRSDREGSDHPLSECSRSRP